MIIWFGVFFASAVADIIWTIYISAIAEKKRLIGASSAALICLIAAFFVHSYVNNLWLVIPYALGAFVGTWITIWWKQQQSWEKK